MESMDVDTFMREGLALSDSDENGAPLVARPPVKKKILRKKSQGQKKREKLELQAATAEVKTKKSRKKVKKSIKSEITQVIKEEAVDKDVIKPSSHSGVTQHKAVIGSLASSDPDFYKFLQEEDKTLLNFDESSEEEEVHQLPESLTEKEDKPKKRRKPADSDESEDDSDSESDDSESESEGESTSKKTKVSTKLRTHGQHVTGSMVEKWSKQLEKRPRIETAENLVKALQGAVMEAAGESKDEVTPFKVEGITTFNAVVRACLRNFPDVFAVLLNYNPKKNTSPAKCKRWGEIKAIIRSYLTALLALLKNLAAPDVINAVLKHVTQLTSYIACMPKQSRVYVKAMISFWSTGEETSRVLSFLALLRLLRLKQEDLLEKTLKSMYMAYVRNCKFSSPTLLPMIGFMQHSLVEIFSLDKLLGYQYTFVYVRQLAIHLRNAMASKKKESYQAVYNWQFIHSCALFARLIGSLHSDENISQLTFPLIQIILGVIRLIPTARFYPLRFQCVRMLNLISLKTGIYIPTLTHILEVIEITDFQKKMSRVNTRPLDFSCILKLSKPQTQDRAFKDGLMDQLYELILDNLVCYSHTLSFPELITPAINQMKQFVKTCKIANFTKLFKQLVSKAEENGEVIKQRRKTSSMDLSNPDTVKEWEAKSRLEGTPITAYYKQYRILRDREVQLEIAGKERMESLDKTPVIPTGQQQRQASESERQEFSTLFDDNQSDDSSDDDDGERFKPKNERKTKKRKLEDDDDASSLNSEEYAMLDKDASEDEGNEGDSQSESADNQSETADQLDDSDNDLDMLEGEDIVEDLQLSD